ncbi:MAG: STAS/SEC14 domain-containing protein [Limisphaerales bacterium]
MPWAIEYLADKETLVVAPTGCVSDDDARELTGQAIALLQETQATRVLSDCRGMESAPSVAAVYWLVHDYANRGVPRQTRIAVVHSKAPQAVELARFYETVCFNRRYQAKAFHSKEAAEAWLCSGQTA